MLSIRKAVPLSLILVFFLTISPTLLPVSFALPGIIESNKQINDSSTLYDSSTTELQLKQKSVISISKLDEKIMSNYHPCPNGIKFFDPVPTLKVNGYIVWATDYKTLAIFLSRLPKSIDYEIFQIVTAAYVKANLELLKDASIGLMGIAFIPNQKIFSTKATVSQDIDPNMENPLDLTKTYFGLEEAKKRGLDLSGKGVRVGLIDSGVNPYVEGLKYYPNMTLRPIELEIAPGLNETEPIKEDMAGHGTHVATILVGSGYYYDSLNKKVFYSPSVEGYMPYATLVSIKVLNKDGYGELAWVIEGFDIALNKNLTVVNMSFGSGAYNGSSDLIAQAANNLWQNGKGVPLVAAAGNNGPMGSSIGSPAVASNVIAVGGFVGRSDHQTLLWVGSSWGPGFYSKIGAPGVPKPDVLGVSTNVYGIDWHTGGIRMLSGTSMATPMITSLVGLLRENFPQANSSEIVTALLKSSEDLGESVERQGVGIPNLALASQYIEKLINGSSPVGEIVINPPRIDTKNIVYRAQVIDANTSLYIGIYASKELSVSFSVNDSNNFDIYFENNGNKTLLLPGYNYFKITLKIKAQTMEPITASLIVNVINGSSSDGDVLTIKSLPRFPEGKILFDASKDRDTMFGYFIGDNSMGKYSYLSYQLEEEGFKVDSNFESRLTNEKLRGYDILVISDPDRKYDDNELRAIRDFITAGGNLFIFAWGLNMYSENFYHGNSSIETINAIVEQYGFTFDSTNSTNDIILAETTNYFGEGYTSLIEWGPKINIQDTENVHIILKNYHGRIFRSVDLIKDQVYGVITKTRHNGYVLAFSSSYLFDNQALKTGYGLINANKAINTAITMFKYVIKPRQAQVEYSFEGTFHKGDNLKVYVQYENNIGQPVSLNGSIRKMWMFTPYLQIIPINLYAIQKEKGLYGVEIPGQYLDYYGEYTFYAPFNYSNLIPTNGKATITIIEPLYDKRNQIVSYTIVLLFIILTGSTISIFYDIKQNKKTKQF